MDELTREVHDVVLWSMLFANDIVLLDEIKGLSRKLLARWRN